MGEYLQVQSLTRQYAKVRGIDDISFSCPEGSFTVLLGPSGAGKTTTLNIIAGILPETAGDVLLRGKSIKNLVPQHRNISMVFEDYALYPTYSVYENIASPLRVRKFAKEKVDRKVKGIARLLGIDQHLEKLPSQISGGQKQRTALARCLVREADIYLLDEPIAHLDAKLRHRMRGEFRRIHQELGKTMIYVSHDYREALALADTVIILNKGKIVQIGGPEEVFSKPRNTFVATLLGDPPMNLVDFEQGEIRNGLLRLQQGDTRIEIRGTSFSDRSLGKVKLGFRHFTVKLKAAQEENCLPGSVYVFESVEDNKAYTITVGRNRVKVVTPREVVFEIDQKLFVKLDPGSIYLFDGLSGVRLE